MSLPVHALTFVCVTSCSCAVFQEERPAFDIHDYGDRIVVALSGVGRRRAFSSIVAGLDNFEACKFLLASLQLVSLHNVNATFTERLRNVYCLSSASPAR